MLWLIGIGIHGFKGINLYSIEILKSIDRILLEQYTSPIDESIEILEGVIGKKVSIVPRWYVEDGREILREAEEKDVALLTYGDPLIATTHIDLLNRAREKKIKVKTIHNASAITSIIGESGLHIYKIGRIATLVNNREANKSVFKIIYDNLLHNLHTILLLEYDQEKGFFLDPRDALICLLEIEDDLRYKIIDRETFVIVASRVGMNGSIYAGKIDSLLKREFGKPPHTIIIPASFHFTELDALKYIELLDEPTDNNRDLRNKSEEMVNRYIPRARRALERARKISLEGFDTSLLLDSAKRYIDDAESFIRNKEYELSILSIGYGEGLIDAISYLKNIELWRE